eukprot:2923551-Lingulodinium_polyedra.AAC.1
MRGDPKAPPQLRAPEPLPRPAVHECPVDAGRDPRGGVTRGSRVPEHVRPSGHRQDALDSAAVETHIEVPEDDGWDIAQAPKPSDGRDHEPEVGIG